MVRLPCLAIVLPVVAVLCCSSSTGEVREYTQAEVLALIEQGRAAGPLLLDVRTSAEYASGHLPGAINIPHAELPDRSRGVPQPPRDRVLRVGSPRGHGHREPPGGGVSEGRAPRGGHGRLARGGTFHRVRCYLYRNPAPR